MDIKRPSDWARQKNQEYLGHFNEARFLDQGHNEIKSRASTPSQQRAPFSETWAPKKVKYSSARSPYAGLAASEGGLGK